jgi:hypothetical protein
MIRRRRILLLLAVAGMIASWPSSAAGQPAPQLIPFPSVVQPGGVLYLAGGGFPPGQSLTVTLVCYNWYQSLFGRWNYILPAEKIPNGTFSGWEIHAGFPFTRASIQCTLTAPYGDNPFAVSTPLYIWSPDANLQPVKIPFQNVHTRPASNTSNFQTFSASTAPGAHLKLVVHYPHMAALTRKVKANWTGQAALKWRVPPSVKKGARAHIVLTGRLGVFSGLHSVHMLARR